MIVDADGKEVGRGGNEARKDTSEHQKDIAKLKNPDRPAYGT
jgi:hypothetical protein